MYIDVLCIFATSGGAHALNTVRSRHEARREGVAPLRLPRIDVAPVPGPNL